MTPRLSALFLFILLTAKALPQKKASLINDFSVSLHEETVNKVLMALGDIRGTSTYEVLLVSGNYTWTIQNPRINIRPDSSNFTCDAIVKVSLFEYKTKVLGDVKISYDNAKNLIYVKITRAIFELYTMMFNKKVHIKNIHLEEYFKEPFSFEGPRSITTEMEFPMPDSTRKKIFIQPTECRMALKWREICTACEIAACEVPAAPIIKLNPPIEGVLNSAKPEMQKEKK